MRKVSIIVVVLFFANFGYAQKSITPTQRTIYAELLGNALIYSLNFEQGFDVYGHNMGLRLGAGYIPSSNESVLIVPFQLNYLLGNRHALEIGMGVSFQYRSSKESELRPSSAIMYRFTSSKGLIFRAGIAPTWLPKPNDAVHIPVELFWFYPGISLGIKF